MQAYAAEVLEERILLHGGERVAILVDGLGGAGPDQNQAIVGELNKLGFNMVDANWNSLNKTADPGGLGFSLGTPTTVPGTGVHVGGVSVTIGGTTYDLSSSFDIPALQLPTLISVNLDLGSGGSIEQFIADTKQELQSAGIDSTDHIVIIGHSLGGAAALELASALSPMHVDMLALLDPVGFVGLPGTDPNQIGAYIDGDYPVNAGFVNLASVNVSGTTPDGLPGFRSGLGAVPSNVGHFYNAWQTNGIWPIDFSTSGQLAVDANSTKDVVQEEIDTTDPYTPTTSSDFQAYLEKGGTGVDLNPITYGSFLGIPYPQMNGDFNKTDLQQHYNFVFNTQVVADMSKMLESFLPPPINGTNGADSIVVAADPTNPNAVTVTINGTPQSVIPVNGEVDINGLGGDDTLTVDLSQGHLPFGTNIVFNGGAGNNRVVLTGNLLPDPSSVTEIVTANGPTSGSVSYSGTGVATTVSYSSTQSVVDLVPAHHVTFSGTSSDDAIELASGPLWGGVPTAVLQEALGGFVPWQFGEKDGLDVNGLGGNDSLTVDFTNGNPIPINGLGFDGGTGTDNQLILQGAPSSAFVNEISTPTGPHSGTISLDGSLITYANLAPISDTVTATDFTINGTAFSEQIGMVSGPVVNGYATTQIYSASNTFELINFANKTKVVVDGNGGNDSFLADFSAGNPIPANGIMFDGGTGLSDPLFLTGTDPAGPYASEVSTPSGPNSGNITLGGATISYQNMGPVTDLVPVVDFTAYGATAGEMIDMIKGPVVSGVPTTEINSGSGTFDRIDFADKTDATLEAVGDGDIFNIYSTSANTTVNGSLWTNVLFNVGNGRLSGINGALTINAGSGTNNRLVINNRSGSAASVVVTSSDISGFAPADIQYYGANGGSFGSGIDLVGSSTSSTYYQVNSTFAGASYEVDEGGAGDTVVVGGGDLDTVQGAIKIVGGAGYDQIQVDDSGNAKSVDYKVTPTSVTSTARPNQAARTFAGVIFDSLADFLGLDGSNVANTFDVTPSLSTQYFINGDLPAPGTVPSRLGDYLRVNFSGVTNQYLSLNPTTPGSGVWQFGSGQMPVQFASIERFNGVESDVAFSEPGWGASSGIKVFDPATGLLKFTIPAASLYGNNYTGGVTAVVGDINGDGIPDIIVAPDCGPNPAVKVFDGVDGHLVWQLNPYADKPNYFGGVSVAIGDVNADGWNDLVVAPGPGAAPGIPVRVFDGNPNGSHARIGADFFPFGSGSYSPLSLAVADQNVNGGANLGQIVVGSTLNGIATIRSFALNGNKFVMVPGTQFQPFGKNCTNVPSLAVGDVNGDGKADIIVGEEVGSNVIMGAFDSTGHTLTPAFTAFSGAPLNEPTILEAHDVNGDGKIDFVSAFYSKSGITGNVTEFSLTSGSPIGQYSANVGNIADLSGLWDNGGQTYTIVENGQNVVITGPNGISEACLLSGANLLLVNGNTSTKVAVVDHEVLRWNNGTAWEKIDIAGLYAVNGSLARIQQKGNQLWLIDGNGKFSTGQITSTSTLSAPNLGLTGNINLGEIDWSGGSKWTKIELANQYTLNGKTTRVFQDGTTTVLVNAVGQTSIVRFIDPTHFIAVDWNNLAGQILNGGLLFANGDKWIKAETIQGLHGTKSVSIQEKGTSLTFVDEYGKKYSAQFISPTRVKVATLGMATIENGKIVFDSGVVWTGLDRNLLYALVSDFGLALL